jgi:hypothetical protein
LGNRFDGVVFWVGATGFDGIDRIESDQSTVGEGLLCPAKQRASGADLSVSCHGALPWRGRQAEGFIWEKFPNMLLRRERLSLSIEAFVQAANHKLLDLLRLWNDTRGDRPMPSRAELDVTALKPWLGNLALIDVLGDDRARFRLCGTNLRVRFGGEMTGRVVTSLDPEIGQSFRDCLLRACRTGIPAEATHERIIGRIPAAFSELCLPLSEDAVHVHTLLFASYRVTTES